MSLNIIIGKDGKEIGRFGTPAPVLSEEFVNKYRNTTDPAIQQMIAKAIHLPDCPVKREHAIASRAWLEKQFNAYIVELKKQYEQPTKPINQD